MGWVVWQWQPTCWKGWKSGNFYFTKPDASTVPVWCWRPGQTLERSWYSTQFGQLNLMSAEDSSSDKRQTHSGGGEVRLATFIFFPQTSLYLGHLLKVIIQPKGRSFPSVNPFWEYLQGHMQRSVSRRFQILSSWYHGVIAHSWEKNIISVLLPTT